MQYHSRNVTKPTQKHSECMRSWNCIDKSICGTRLYEPGSVRRQACKGGCNHHTHTPGKVTFVGQLPLEQAAYTQVIEHPSSCKERVSQSLPKMRHQQRRSELFFDWQCRCSVFFRVLCRYGHTGTSDASEVVVVPVWKQGGGLMVNVHQPHSPIAVKQKPQNLPVERRIYFSDENKYAGYRRNRLRQALHKQHPSPSREHLRCALPLLIPSMSQQADRQNRAHQKDWVTAPSPERHTVPAAEQQPCKRRRRLFCHDD